MDWSTLLIIGIISILITKLVNVVYRRESNSPPGPFPLPLVGNLVYIGRQDPVNYIGLHKVSQKYGDVTSLRMGLHDYVLISKIDVAKAFYSRPDCLNRPTNGAIWERNLHQNIGMAFSTDEEWNNIRKFTSRVMREYGFGNKSAMEKLIKSELVYLVKFLEDQVHQSKNGVVYFDDFFHISFINVMTLMITGKRHDYTDIELQNLGKATKQWFEAPLLGVLIVMAFPWTRFICPDLLGYTCQMNSLKKMISCARKILDEHRKQDFMENPMCFTDSFLKAAYNNKDDPNSPFTDDQFAILFTDLIQGGSDTTSIWMSFAIVILTLHQDVQNEIVREIENVIGLENLPESRHRDSMLYTQAVILEIHRLLRLAVILPPRISTEDFHYRNYLIKKGSVILVNLHSCFMDPETWKEPQTFCPERFLSSDRTKLINAEMMSINFGAGRRVCFGEAMTKESTFLYLTTLLQRFSFKCPPPKYPGPDIELVPGVLLSPKPFYAKVERRCQVNQE